MDYMSGLPSTKHGNDFVFMVVDRFSKMAIMEACNKNITAEATAKLFFERLMNPIILLFIYRSFIQWGKDNLGE